MNNTGPLSPPTSIASNDWADRPARGPYPPHGKPLPPNAEYGRRNLATPPVSGQMSGYPHPPSSPGGPNSRGPPPHGYRGNPSPPNSVAARSSSGTQVSVEAQRRKQEMIENMLGQSYGVLKRHLASQAADGKLGRRPNKARHKLVQLTPMQFQELSKDVCDELLRRTRHEQWKKQGGNGPEPPKFLPPMEDIHPKRNQARQTLSELPDERFLTLASDTFFEIERRVPRIPGGDIARGGSPANSMRGPPGRTGTPPNGMRPGSRDQMRRPPPRQNSLGGQVMAGLGIPGVDDYNNRPAPKSTQANTMVPNKSYLVEEDDEGDGESMYDLSRRHTGATSHSFGSAEKAEFQEKVNSLEGRVNEMQKQLQEKDSTIQQLESNHRELETSHQGLESTHRELESSHQELQSTHMGHQDERRRASDEWTNLRSDLEAKLTDAQSLNSRLHDELDRLKAQHGDRERDLTHQIGILTTQSSDADGQWRTRHDALQAGHESLQTRHSDLEQELADQQRTTDEVRSEVAGFIAEVRKLSERSDQGWKKEEAVQRHVQDLEAEVQDWKDRYSRAQAQLADGKMGSNDRALPPPDFGNLDTFVRPDGMILNQHVIDCKLRVNELLFAAHQGTTNALMKQVKAVVGAIQGIRSDVKHAAQAKKQSGLVQATAKNFITATLNYIYAPQASPILLLDAAASHLAGSIIELVKTVGMRPFVDGEHAASGVANSRPAAVPRVSSDDDDGFDFGAYDEPEGQALSVNGTRSSASESVYSLATAATAVPAGHGLKPSGPANARLPSASYQTPRSAHTRQVSAAGMVNGQGGSVRQNAGYDVQEADEDLAELKHFLDEQSGPLTETINSLLGAIRRNAPRREITGLVKRIIDAAAHILRTLQAAADAWPTPALGDALAQHCGALAEGRKSLLAAAQAIDGDDDEEDEDMQRIPEPEYRKAVNGWPQVAFKIAGALRELGASVDEVAQGHLGDHDFR